MYKGGQRPYSHRDNIRTQSREPLSSTTNRVPPAPSMPSNLAGSNVFPGSPQFDQLLLEKKSNLHHVPYSMMHDGSKPMFYESGQEGGLGARGLEGEQLGAGRSGLQQPLQQGLGRQSGLQQPLQQGMGTEYGTGYGTGMATGLATGLGTGMGMQSGLQQPLQQGLGGGFIQHREEPTQYLKEERPAVLKEKILPVEEESIQPVIHREVERREIHEVLQPIHEKQVLAPIVEEKQLPAEIRPQVGAYVPRTAVLEQSSLQYENVERHRFVNTPIVEETVRKTVIEEVQPVIHRETVAPHIIRETLPIYEKFVEPEVVLKETRPMIETSAPSITSTTQTFEKPLIQENVPLTSAQKYVFDIEQKTKIIPHAQGTVYRK